jgi:ribosomal-protein-alanine N-acetyltransferase
MLTGKTIRLRLLREDDLARVYEFHQDISNRGLYFPIGVMAEPVFRSRFQESGFWEENEGMLLIVNGEDEIIGHIEFFRTLAYLDELELSYHIYTTEQRSKGAATEAVKLMVGYLFDSKKVNRIRLIIHPDNAASKRIAQKCGFKYEGLARGAWFNRGRNHDVEVHALLRNEHLASG